jgi:two-component system, cell cycle sensor histidine kinase and response regulator CckA
VAGEPILIVDDNPTNLKLARVVLAGEGYDVRVAVDAEEALAMLDGFRPRLILMDLQLPGMDGLTLTRRLKGDPATSGVAILALTAYAMKGDEEKARRAGCDGYITKPIDTRTLPAVIAGVLAGRGDRASGEAGEAELAALHRQRVQAQLERQSLQNRALPRQAGIQATALALMRSLSEVLGQPANVPEVIGDVLVQCLDAAGLSTGLLYLVEAESRYRLQAHSGIAAAMRQDAEACFGHPEIIHAIVASGRPAALTAAAVPDVPGVGAGAAASFLTRLGRPSAMVVPFVVMGETFGVLVLASDHQDLADNSWLGFAGSLAVQFGQTVALGQSLNRLAASEERYRALMEQAHDAILVLDLDQHIQEANRAALDLLGRPRQDIVGRSYDDFVAPEELEESRRSRASVAVEGKVRVPLRHLVRADGSRVAVETSVSLVRIGDESTILAILRDITERQRLETQFQQAQKMESVGRLAGGVAHDFNNLLTLILGYGNMVLQALADRPAVSRQVEAIVRAGESAAGLTRQLLAFSRHQVLVPTVIDVNALIRQLEQMLRRLIGEDIELVTDLEPRLGRIRADAGQIEQVLMNLAVNARDAMPGGGRLNLSTRNHPAVAEAAATHVVLKVADTGCGIDAAVMAHLFEPFFTTKEAGKGTGLGLATVYGIVHQSGGQLEVESVAGEGASFAIYLPRTDEPATPASAATAAAGRGNETILVVEDEASIRVLAREILEGQGYAVLEAAGADEALRRAAEHTGPIHLLLTDVVMPCKGGVELAQDLLARRPGLRVVYMSGYADRAVPADAPGVAFVQKPFDSSLLARRVRATLDRRREDS